MCGINKFRLRSQESTDRVEVIIHFGEKEGLGEGARKMRERERGERKRGSVGRIFI